MALHPRDNREYTDVIQCLNTLCNAIHLATHVAPCPDCHGYTYKKKTMRGIKVRRQSWHVRKYWEWEEKTDAN